MFFETAPVYCVKMIDYDREIMLLLLIVDGHIDILEIQPPSQSTSLVIITDGRL